MLNASRSQLPPKNISLVLIIPPRSLWITQKLENLCYLLYSNEDCYHCCPFASRGNPSTRGLSWTRFVSKSQLLLLFILWRIVFLEERHSDCCEPSFCVLFWRCPEAMQRPLPWLILWKSVYCRSQGTLIFVFQWDYHIVRCQTPNNPSLFLAFFARRWRQHVPLL